MSEEIKFPVNTRVSWNGMKGTVVNIDPTSDQSIEVDFDMGSIYWFYKSGKFHEEMTRPCLKKLVKKKYQSKEEAFTKTFPFGKEFELNESPKKKTVKYLAYTDSEGELRFVLEGSDFHKRIKENYLPYERTPALDKEVEINEEK